MSELTGSILVVDDNRMNRLMLARGLEQQGHRVSFAEHGRQALEMMRNQAFDLVLLDIEMPEMNGYEVLEHLRADPHWRDIPVIMISAVDEIDSVVRCIEMGAADYLNKPFNPVLLKARVNACLEKKRLLDTQRELFRKFATDEVAEELLTSGFSLGGKLVDATVLFCDIRSFTTLAESQSPDDTIELLNAYYALIIDATAREGGMVSLMAGDGLMSIFGAPLAREDHRQQSVKAAMQMIELVDRFNQEQALFQRAPLPSASGSLPVPSLPALSAPNGAPPIPASGIRSISPPVWSPTPKSWASLFSLKKTPVWVWTPRSRWCPRARSN